MKRLLVCAVMFFSVFSASADSAVQSSAAAVLSPHDAGAVRAVMEKYRTAWLANNPEQVRSVFSRDAVIMPHHGLQAAAGMNAIDAFWFPPDAPKTTILKYVRPIDELGGDGTLAFARGRSEIAWRVENKGGAEEWTTSGTYLAILKRRADGAWLITHMIWDDLPNRRTN
jgi:uncharacterized protein (TIGR02246 family)